MGAGAGVLCVAVSRTSSTGSDFVDAGSNATCADSGSVLTDASFAGSTTVAAVVVATIALIAMVCVVCGEASSFPFSVLRYSACGKTDFFVEPYEARFLFLFLDPRGRPLLLGTRYGF
jgi:hypothetical protein